MKFKRAINIYHHLPLSTRQQREKIKSQRGCVLLFTGLSGSGKSTLAYALDKILLEKNQHSYVLDGDNTRQTLSADLGFSKKDRQEHLRRLSVLAYHFVDAGIITIISVIAPFKEDRDNIKQIIETQNYFEIYCACRLKICEQRDPKGLYKQARENKILNFTGISSPYEKPKNPDLIIDTEIEETSESIEKIINLMIQKKII